jgi:hypothetical protein
VSIILLKALLGLPLIFLALLGIYTMFEVLGRKEKKYDIAKLKAVHLWNGYLFLLLLLATGALGTYLVAGGNVVLGAKTTFHLVLALAAIFLLLIKISCLRAYRLFYSQVAGFGLAIALLVIIAAAISSGYYLLVHGFAIEGTAASAMVEPD